MNWQYILWYGILSIGMMPMAHAQMVIEWEHAFGGAGQEEARVVVPTQDGGYLVAGYTNSTDGDVQGLHGEKDDLWILRLNGQGQILWSQCFGGSLTDYGHGWGAIELGDGSFVIVGNVWSNDGDVSGNHGQEDGWVIKISDAGKLMWQQCYGGPLRDMFTDVLQTKDGGFLVVGGTNSNSMGMTTKGGPDGWLMKLDRAGNQVWQKTYGGSMAEQFLGIALAKGGGYFLAGYTYSSDGSLPGHNGGADSWVMKVDGKGKMLWQKVTGRSGEDYTYRMAATEDGGLILTGYSISPVEDSLDRADDVNAWVLKLNKQGNQEWSKTYGGSGYDGAYGILQTEDGGYLFSGNTNSKDGDASTARMKTTFSRVDPTGTSLMSTQQDAWLVKLDAKGNVVWQKTFGGSGGEVAMDLAATPDGSYIFTGTTSSNDGDVSGYHDQGKHYLQDYWVVKLKPVEKDPENAEATNRPDTILHLDETFLLPDQERMVVFDEVWEVAHTDIKIQIWDHNKYDYDQVALYLNGEKILANYVLQKAPREVSLQLLPNAENALVLFAINEGLIPPNTATITIIDGERTKTIELTSSLSRSGAIKLIHKDP